MKITKRKMVKLIREEVERDMQEQSTHGKFGAGLSSDGYAGGYAQALSDFALISIGVWPNSRYAEAARRKLELANKMY